MAAQPDSIGFVYEGSMLRITGVKRGTWQNWDTVGILTIPEDGRFREADVVEVAIAGALVSVLGRKLPEVATAWTSARDAVLASLLAHDPTAPSLLLVEPRLLRVELVDPRSPVEEVLRQGESTIGISLTDLVRGLRKDFWRFAKHDKRVSDGRRRDARAAKTSAPTRRREA